VRDYNIYGVRRKDYTIFELNTKSDPNTNSLCLYHMESLGDLHSLARTVYWIVFESQVFA